MKFFILNSTLNSQLSTLNSQLSTLNSQLSTLNSQLSTLNSQLSTLNSQLSTLNSSLSSMPRALGLDLGARGTARKERGGQLGARDAGFARQLFQDQREQAAA